MNQNQEYALECAIKKVCEEENIRSDFYIQVTQSNGATKVDVDVDVEDSENIEEYKNSIAGFKYRKKELEAEIRWLKNKIEKLEAVISKEEQINENRAN